jgi:anti-sigma factor RsiW
MTTRHPSRRRLQRWLDSGETRRVSKHIDGCDHCQAALEELSALDEELVADLQAATTPPGDLRERTQGGVDVRLRHEAAMVAFGDLFAIAWDVVRMMVDTDTESESAHEAGSEADETRGGAS